MSEALLQEEHAILLLTATEPQEPHLFARLTREGAISNEFQKKRPGVANLAALLTRTRHQPRSVLRWFHPTVRSVNI